LSKLNVTVSVAETTLVRAVPPVNVIVSPLATVSVVTPSEIMKSLIVPGAEPEAALVILPC